MLESTIGGEEEKHNVPAWSAALQAVWMHVATPLRKPVAVQMQCTSVKEQPVDPMALMAQDCWVRRVSLSALPRGGKENIQRRPGGTRGLGRRQC